MLRKINLCAFSIVTTFQRILFEVVIIQKNIVNGKVSFTNRDIVYKDKQKLLTLFRPEIRLQLNVNKHKKYNRLLLNI